MSGPISTCALANSELNTVSGIRYLLRERGCGIVTNRADEYRRRAQQCLEMAGAFRELEAWTALANMAEVWLRLADDWDDASDRLRQSNQKPGAAPSMK
jgi:hypothetical protein